MASISYTVEWEPVVGAASYRLYEVDNAGLETELATDLSDPWYVLEIDEAADHLFLVRPVFTGGTLGEYQQVVYRAPWTRATLRLAIRTELKDSVVGKYRWSDDELNQYLDDAIQDYSTKLPRSGALHLHLTKDVQEYRLPSFVQTVKRVTYTDEDGNEAVLKLKPWKGGESSYDYSRLWKLGIQELGGSRYYVGHYDFREQVLSLDFKPTGEDHLEILYGGPYTVPIYDTQRLDVPPEDIELLKLYVCGKATVRIENQDANLQRWDQGTGRRDDSPLIPLTNRYFNAYNQGIRERRERPRHRRLVRV